MKKIHRLFSVVLALLMLCPLLPVQNRVSAYYSAGDLTNIESTILSNTERKNYVDTMMRYHILSATDDYRVARNLQSGKSVIFFFDGCSDNMDSATYSDYTRYHLSAYCAVVQQVNGVPKIVYESENCSTIPDNPRNVSLNEGSAVPTVLDGVYNIISTNHLGRYASLRIADNSGSAPVMRCTSSSSYTSTSSAINIHARSNFNSAPTNGISSSSYSSTGCFLVGLTNNTWSEYNRFTAAVLGISNAIKTTPYSSGSWTQCTTGVDKGLVVVDRMNYKTQLQKIYGGDNNHSASALVAKLTAYTDNLNVEIPDASDDTRPLAAAYEDFLPIYAYPTSTGNVPVYDAQGQQLSNRFITGSTDLCIINKIYSDGWCYVSYPSSVEADGYAEAYAQWSTFAENPSPTQWKSGTGYTVYRRIDLSETLGSIDAGDSCLRVSRVGELDQVIYPVTGSGYFKMGWIEARSQSGIRLSSLPEKRDYQLGETLDLTGLAVQKVYDDGLTDPLSDGYTVSPMVLSQTGEQTVIVTSGAYSATFTVNVESLAPTLTLDYPTLSFEDQIQYNVYFTVSDMTNVVEMGLITFDSRLSEGTMADAVNVIPGYTTSSSSYIAHTNGIPAKNLGDALYFKVYAKLTNGTYIYTDIAGYNAVAYAKTILGSSTTSMDAKRLMVAMLNYGAQAQLAFGYKTDSLMNAFLTVPAQNLVNPYDESMVASVTAPDASKAGHFQMDTSAFSSVYPTVSFEGAFSVNFYFTNKLTPDDGLTLCYWDAAAYQSADKLLTSNATGQISMTYDGESWHGAVEGIAAKEIDQPIYVVAYYKSNGVTHTTSVIAYSLGRYCESIAANGNAFGAATAVYGYYAKAYFA